MIYLALAIVVLVLAFTAYGVFAVQTSIESSGSKDALQNVQLAVANVPSECGDITDLKNVEHLSHHPDKYGQCYPFVNPATFKQATGQDISNFIKK